MDELRKEKNRLALEKVELLDKIASYENREDLSRDDKADALEELNERLGVLEEELTKARQAYNVEVSKTSHEENSLAYEQIRNVRESQAMHEEGQAKYQQMREDRRANEQMFLNFISQNESARNEFMRGASIEDIKARHAGEIEAFERNMNNPVDTNVTDVNQVSNDGSGLTLDGIANGTVDDSLAMQAMVESANRNNVQEADSQNLANGDRPVYADPANAAVAQASVPVSNETVDPNVVVASPEIAGQEAVEPTMEANQADNKTLFEKAKDGFNGILSTEGSERKVVKKIASNAAIVAVCAATYKIALAVLHPLLAVAGVAGAVWMGNEFMKGRKL